MIKKTTKIVEIMEKYPRVARVLGEKYQLHCLGCFSAAFETLEEGAKNHQMSDKEIEAMIKELNQLIKLKKRPAKADLKKS